jgi:hypothetical protein
VRFGQACASAACETSIANNSATPRPREDRIEPESILANP